MTTDIPVTRHIPLIPEPTVAEHFASLVQRGFHPHLMATEGAKYPYVAWVRGGPEVGGESPEWAMRALVAWVDRVKPPTTRELRRAGPV